MIEIIAFLLSVTGGILVAERRIEGFYLWIIANTLWLNIFGYSWVGAMFWFYIALSVFSIFEWRRIK